MREIDESQEDRLQKVNITNNYILKINLIKFFQLKAIAIKQKKQIADLKQLKENDIKKHNLEKNVLMNKITALAEQGKLARVIRNVYILVYY